MTHTRYSRLLSLGIALTSTSYAQAHSDFGQAGTSSIVGGQSAKACAWPSVFFVKTKAKTGEGMCTATLVHPRVLLYAAHCGIVLHARIGEDVIAPSKTLEADAFVESQAYPDYEWLTDVEHDWAYAVLKEPILDIPIVPVAHSCEYDQLVKSGTQVHLVGFSPNKRSDEENPEPKEGNYPLRWATSKVGDVSHKGRLTTGGNGVHGCGGDSGGPLMAKLPDGSWRTIGITSTLTGKCREKGAYASYSHARKEMIAWVEKESGIDITPCYSLDGSPTPSAECDRSRAYADHPNSPKGTREKNCSEAPTVLVRKACQVPESGEPQPEDTSTTSSDENPGDTTTESSSSGESSNEDNTDSSETSDSTGSSDSSPSQESPKESGDSKSKLETQKSTPQGSDSPKGQDSIAPAGRASGCSTAPAPSTFLSLAGLLMLFRRRRPNRFP